MVEFEGTLLLVSHDREFLENVVTSTLVFAGQGQVIEHAGAVPQWDQLWQSSAQNKSARATKKAPRPRRKDTPPRPKRLKSREAQELAHLPETIEAKETELEALHAEMAAEEFYRQDEARIKAAIDRLEPLENEIAAAYRRWEELDALQQTQE
ncbi:MAG: hypothetical protein R6Y91_05465 [Desulfohalobium sp.]